MASIFGKMRGWFKRKPKGAPMPLSQRHSKALEIFTERYTHSCSVFAATLFSDGQIPGFEKIPPSTLRAFFQKTNPQYWAALAEQSPEEAYTQLAQWSQAEGA